MGATLSENIPGDRRLRRPRRRRIGRIDQAIAVLGAVAAVLLVVVLIVAGAPRTAEATEGAHCDGAVVYLFGVETYRLADTVSEVDVKLVDTNGATVGHTGRIPAPADHVLDFRPYLIQHVHQCAYTVPPEVTPSTSTLPPATTSPAPTTTAATSSSSTTSTDATTTTAPSSTSTSSPPPSTPGSSPATTAPGTPTTSPACASKPSTPATSTSAPCTPAATTTITAPDPPTGSTVIIDRLPVTGGSAVPLAWSAAVLTAIGSLLLAARRRGVTS